MERRTQRPRRLVAGELVRLEPDGPQWEVERVSYTSALLRLLRPKPVLVEIPGREPFLSRHGGRQHVSPCAFVYREENA